MLWKIQKLFEDRIYYLMIFSVLKFSVIPCIPFCKLS